MITPKPERITPTLAANWLDHNKDNRKLRDGLVEKYASDMKNGAWTACAAPIWFYENGDIADGQHRLWAIVESGVAQDMLVGRGLSKEDRLNIDTGAPRNLVDNAKISGIDGSLSINLIALCRGIEQGDRASQNLSNAQRLEMVARHRDAAQFAIHRGAKGNRLNNAVINGAIARAWYYEADKEKLARFGMVLSSGFQEGERESAAVALRNYAMANNNFTDGRCWRDSFLKSQNAVYYFMRGKPLTVIKGIADERYPLFGAASRPAAVSARIDKPAIAPKAPPSGPKSKHNPEPPPSASRSKPKVMVVGLWPSLRAKVHDEFKHHFDLRYMDARKQDHAAIERLAPGCELVICPDGIKGEIQNMLHRVSKKFDAVHGSQKAIFNRLTKFAVEQK